MNETLRCREVSVDHGDVRAVARLDLSVFEGETVALLGPSGSGKSTLMYAVAGFLDITEGVIEIAGEVMSSEQRTTAPEKRPVGFVFQNYALWPHLDAEHTVAYPLRRAGMAKREAVLEARRLLELVDIADLAYRKPAEMSGGQQQRVGLARALARDADLYLFDEPTAHLDAAIKGAVQQEIRRRRDETGAAALYTTHDSAEALAIADRVAIIRAGEIVQSGTPEDVYDRPVDIWAATLTGPASVLEIVGRARSEFSVDVDLGGAGMVAQAGGWSGSGAMEMLVRPEWVSIGGSLPGRVTEVWYRGSHTDYRIQTALGTLDARSGGAPTLREGEETGVGITRGWIPGSVSRG